MKTVYLVAGVSGAGKSWVLDNAKINAIKIKSDKIASFDALIAAINNATSDHVVVEKTSLISTLIKKLTHVNIQLLVVGNDFLKVKAQLVARGGKVTPGIYRRWKRMKVLSQNYDAVVGSSDDIKRWLENNIKNNLVYSATAPNGKTYIGQTSKTLEERKVGHLYTASSKQSRNKENTLFHNALLKYEDRVQWRVLADNLSNSEANICERRFIKEMNTAKDGYNMTTGGRQNFVHSDKTKELIAQKASSHSKLHWNKDRKDKASVGMRKQWRNNSLLEKRTSAIRKVRSSDEQKKLSSENNIKRYSDVNKRNEMAIACGAKKFNVFKDGALVGTWINAAQCAKELKLVTKTHISNVLHGRRKTYCGYVFSFVSESSKSQTEELKT